jgi:hypothetical protein
LHREKTKMNIDEDHFRGLICNLMICCVRAAWVCGRDGFKEDETITLCFKTFAELLGDEADGADMELRARYEENKADQEKK